MAKRLGLALSGGGVLGFGHIRVLELLDELGLRPNVIAGSSIGAVIGALYASGISGRGIRELAEEYSVQRGDALMDVVKKLPSLLKWLRIFIPERRRGGLIGIDRFLTSALEPIEGVMFENLNVPLIVVATDFWTAEEVVVQKGEVVNAVRASMAIPGVFAPVSIDGRVLVDGDLVNRVPYDHLSARSDVTLAVEVSGQRRATENPIPRVPDAVYGALVIMQKVALDRRLAYSEPDILFRARMQDVSILDFGKIGAVLDQMEQEIEGLRSRLSDMELWI